MASQDPVWLKSIKSYGLPHDRASQMSLAEGSGTLYIGWDGRVFAVDSEDGHRRWSLSLRRFGLANPDSHYINMIFRSGYLYAIFNSRVFRLNPNNGQILESRRSDMGLSDFLNE